MTAYRFRVKFDPDPTSLWRDIVVGADRTLNELQATINAAMGLDQDHLWFFGIDEDYWDSDVKYQRPEEHEDLPSGQPMRFGEETYNAGETTVGEMVAQLGLDQYDRICYLFDYGDEWRFYAILKEIVDDEPDDQAHLSRRKARKSTSTRPPARRELPFRSASRNSTFPILRSRLRICTRSKNVTMSNTSSCS